MLIILSNTRVKALQHIQGCAISASRQKQAVRSVWGEGLDQREAIKAESFYDSTVEKYAEMPLEVLTLEQMLHVGRNALTDPARVVRSAQFVQEELPKRLARRLLDLQLLPYIVVTNPHIKRVYNAYYHAFEVLRKHPRVTDLASNREFCSLLRRLVDEHAPMLDALAAGLREARSRALVGPALQLDTFLDAMLRSRISRRVIAEQHLHIADTRPGYLGSIATHLDVADSVEFAGQRAAQACTERYGMAPELVVTGNTRARLAYIPGHLDYMLHELLKNAMRAVVEKHRNNSIARRRRMETVQARICAGRELLTIRISDQGGGIAPEHVDKVFSYGFTTIPGGSSTVEEEVSLIGGPGNHTSGAGTSAAAAAGGGLGDLLAAAAQPPALRFALAGLGFGLPMSRLYARYFGGDLVLHNIPGYGVDVFLTLPYLDTSHWQEQQETSNGDLVGRVGAQVGVRAATDLHQQLQQLKHVGSTREAAGSAAPASAPSLVDRTGGEANGSEDESGNGGGGTETDTAESSDEANNHGGQNPVP